MSRTIGENIRYVRRCRDWTQEQLGARIGVKGSNVACWERGKVIPGTSNLSKIAKVLEVTMDDLVTGRGIFLPAGMGKGGHNASTGLEA